MHYEVQYVSMISKVSQPVHMSACQSTWHVASMEIGYKQPLNLQILSDFIFLGVFGIVLSRHFNR